MLMKKIEESRKDTLWFGNTTVTILVSSADSADGMAIIEHHVPHGDGPPLHVHQTEDEIFYVLSGDVLLEVAGVGRTLKAGDCLNAPKGMPHRFRVVSKDGARWLTVTKGADFETMVRTVSRLPTHAGLPTAAAPTPEMIEALTAACARNHIDIVGPPLMG